MSVAQMTHQFANPKVHLSGRLNFSVMQGQILATGYWRKVISAYSECLESNNTEEETQSV